MKVYNFAGWLAVGLLFLGLNSLRWEPAPTVDLLAAYAVDTVTYSDGRIVYKLATDTSRNSNGDLRRLPDLTNAPAGARWRVIWDTSTYDSVMLVTGDTFAMSPMDSAAATALASSWGVIDPYTVSLAWHVPPGSAPDPLENVVVSAHHDTLRTAWTSVGDSVRIFSGLNAGGQEDTFYVAGNSTPHNRVVTVEGSFYSCGNAYTTQAAADYADNRCNNATVDTSTGGGGGDWANEPGSYTQITDRGFTAADEDGWSDNDASAQYDVPITDATAPTSASNVARVTFPAASWVGGSSPCSRCAVRNFAATGEVFAANAFKVSSNWHGHSSGVNKIWWVESSTIPDSKAFGTFAAFGIDGGGLTFQYRLANNNTGSLSAGRNLSGNVSSSSLTRGVWYEIEVHLVMNTSDNYDGELHVWMDGVKTHEYTDVRHFSDTGVNHEIDEIYWGPVYGGIGDEPPAEQYQYMDHFYISAP